NPLSLRDHIRRVVEHLNLMAVAEFVGDNHEALAEPERGRNHGQIASNCIGGMAVGVAAPRHEFALTNWSKRRYDSSLGERTRKEVRHHCDRAECLSGRWL